MSKEMESYFGELERKIKEIYEVARKARALGKDPELEPEIPMAGDLAARVETLVGPVGVAAAIRELEKNREIDLESGEEKAMAREEMALKIAEMIVDGKFGRADEKQTAEQAIRTALAILTEGIVVAPLEGITEVKIKKNADGTQYLALYYASPIRAAGGTAAALSVLAGDFVRRRLYLDPYKPTEREVERFVEEVDLYKIVAREQYTPSADEVRLALRNLPVEITGEPTDKSLQVTAYRDLERVEHNFIRGGAILVLIEGVVQKAQKIKKYVEKLHIDGWGWLSEFTTKTPTEEVKTEHRGEKDYLVAEAEQVDEEHKYLDEVIAGRPVFSHPGTGRGKDGGFRLRYGRSRNTGIAAVGVHPATMVICNEFIAVGTQLKTERPGKGGAVTSVDSIEGPVVKLDDGSVVRINTVEEALQLRERVVEILFLGDILIGFGEFLENNHPLVPSGYCEEWWAQEVELALGGRGFAEEISRYISPPYPRPASELAIKISEELGVPLHPAYTYPYHSMAFEELWELGRWLSSGVAEFSDGRLVSLTISVDPSMKRLLEELGVPHTMSDGRVVLEDHALPLCRCLGLIKGEELNVEKLQETLQSSQTKEINEIVGALAGFTVRKKAPTYIGARMGRPEKANPREMKPPVHMLFPVGFAGGKMRNLVDAASKGEVEVEVAKLECKQCGATSFSRKCQACGAVAEYLKVCPMCGQPMGGEKCPRCNARSEYFSKRKIDLKSLLDAAVARLGEEMPELVKGVQGMTSEYKIPEPIEKGILRAKHDVYVFKDGTVRFDATDVPLTHFRPREIGVPVERLRELGYTKDFRGQPLESEDQVAEMKVQDIILSSKAADYLLRASNFVDDLLQKVYGLAPHYSARTIEDLVGHVVLGLAPHTSVGTAGRIIGFTKASVGYAHPFFHAAKRRDCDGDEDCVMLLLDALLNFSKRFLPSGRGGRMDAPLILNMKINPKEIDKQAHNMDVMERYPLEFYKATLRFESPGKLKFMSTVASRLDKKEQYEGMMFSFDTSDFSSGSLESKYKTLETMEEKLQAQLGLAEKIRAVDERDVAELVIEHHFIPDLKGNTRKFAAQEVRCINCNNHHRRIPLNGVCGRCGGKLILTISKGGAEKYLMVAMNLADKYNVSDYTKQRLMLSQRDIKSTFESDAARQTSLADFL
ncbi:MAG: DNA polymerase II large subunit [Candidatus Hadarchaeota archaeon]